MKGDNKKSKEVKIAEAKERMQKIEVEKVHRLGPRDKNWRNSFLTVYSSLLNLDLNIHQMRTNMKLIRVEMEKLKGDQVLERTNHESAIEADKIRLLKAEVDRMVVRDQILFFLGAEWTIKSVLGVLSELERLQGEAFERSKKGENESGSDTELP